MRHEQPLRLSGKMISIPIGADVRSYFIAFVNADGSFYIARKFYADNDAAANEYAAEHYGDRDWYVLDARGSNINGGAA